MQTPIRLLPSLMQELQALADCRGQPYAHQSALLVRWETDRSNARADVAAMTDLLDTNFGIQSNVHVIPRRGQSFTWDLVAKILELRKTDHDLQEPTLFIFYYAGDAGVPMGDASLQPSLENEGSENFALENEGNYIPWSAINDALCSKGNKDSDVLVILDSPFGDRHNDLHGTTELLAACRGAHYRRMTPISFTLRIRHAVHSLKGDRKSMTMNDLFAALEDQHLRVRPFSTAPSGKSPILLTFKQETSPSTPVRVPPIPQNVIVKLTIPDTTDGLSSFRQAIQELPENMKVDVLAAYQAD
ncbi:uncharacterized protein N7483_012041 [Penicillium malachiteum]|uniref:uncharacterized protein n=1 Tax=Penicillium malachiteum TaxID=1324776 RepID=UPI002547BE93|nr:uncharacterized protein N7483_012041 [Penicillium malachiteum]KAJ5714860.1 hypothetical protein N7483_012041 [Penicillium malachiteum]